MFSSFIRGQISTTQFLQCMTDSLAKPAPTSQG